MNGISHKQAIKWIHRRLDGLLTERQLLILEEHLHSCDSCRAYASEIDLLPMILQSEFHARWDAKPWPSPKVFEHVTAKAKRIPMTNRISSGIKLFAGVVTLVMLGFFINSVVSHLRNTSTTATEIEVVNVPPRADDRLLAFTSAQNGNFDIYTMRADGSGLTNLTNHPANDTSPFWSPDGNQIAFVSERAGSLQIYLMEADGSNVIQLTKGEGIYLFDINGYSPWSPDGRNLIFSYASPGTRDYKLYSMDADGKNKAVLMNETGIYLLPSWSRDGKHIAFMYYGSDTAAMIPHLFIVDKNGNNLREITESLRIERHATFLGDYYWSQDGASIFFMVGTRETVDVYKAGLDGSLMPITESTRTRWIIDWWNGITFQTNENGRSLNWLRSNGSKSTLEVCSSSNLGYDQGLNVVHKRSYSGNLIFGSSCSASSSWMLYWANPDGTITDKLLDSGIPGESLFGMTWSPDDHFVAFVAMDDSPDFTDTLYVLDIVEARKDPSVEPLKMTGSYGPSWQPIP